jgi:hypothetical protein
VKEFGNFGPLGQIVQATPTRNAVVDDEKIGGDMWHKKRKIVNIQYRIVLADLACQNMNNLQQKR